MIATASPAASRVGIKVLDRGGNAVDAAVASTFAVGVTRPELCGIGGGGFMVYRGADGKTASLDFRETAPAEYTFTAGVGVGPALAFGTGHNVVGVPGTVAGLAAASKRYGKLRFSRLIAPAERIAREGFTVTGYQSELMALHLPRLRLYEETANTYLQAGLAPYPAGATLRQPGYADSLALIRDRGPSAFYRGPIADRIAAAMASSGRYPGDRGTMTSADLASYRAVWRKPASTSYRGHRVIGMGPPSSGGIATVEILNLLEGFRFRRAGQSSARHLHLLAEAEKLAWADRNEYVGDPDFVRVPTKRLTSKRYADKRRSEIELRVAKTYDPAGGAASGDPPGQTTHVSVIDRRGNAVAITCTIEQIFGSAVIAPGTGFLLNNQLTDFGDPGTANGPAPGKRPRSSTSPTIVARKGVPRLVVGGAGGPSIIMGAVQAVINTIDFGLDPAQAIDAERIDARGLCDGDGLQLCMENARIDPAVIETLRSRGHEIRGEGEYALGPVMQAVGTHPRRPIRFAASDPRFEGGRPEGDGAMAQRSRR